MVARNWKIEAVAPSHSVRSSAAGRAIGLEPCDRTVISCARTGRAELFCDRVYWKIRPPSFHFFTSFLISSPSLYFPLYSNSSKLHFLLNLSHTFHSTPLTFTNSYSFLTSKPIISDFSQKPQIFRVWLNIDFVIPCCD